MSQARKESFLCPAVRVIAAVLVLLVCAASAGSASPIVHHAFHQESATEGHQCLICSFAGAQVDVAHSSIEIALSGGLSPRAQTDAMIPVFTQADFLLPSGRAPPLVLSA